MQDTKLELNPEVMRTLMVVRAKALFYDPKLTFDDCVQLLGSEFGCHLGVAEDCMGYVVDRMCINAIRNGESA